MEKWFPNCKSVGDGIKTVATAFCENSTEFEGLLGIKIWTISNQRKFTDQFIRTAVECGEEEYKKTNSAEKAIKWAMLYIAYIIAESSLVHHNAKAPPDERTENLSDIINSACFDCKVKITFSNLQRTLSQILLPSCWHTSIVFHQQQVLQRQHRVEMDLDAWAEISFANDKRPQLR